MNWLLVTENFHPIETYCNRGFSLCKFYDTREVERIDTPFLFDFLKNKVDQ